MVMTREICGESTTATRSSGNSDDPPPEFCHYRDEGCEYAASCLECPFPQCLYEIPRGRQRRRKDERNTGIRSLYAQGWSTRELGMFYGISERTVQRVVRTSAAMQPVAAGR